MQEQETGVISKYNEGLCVNTDPDSILMSILDMSLHRQMGSDRDRSLYSKVLLGL